MNHPLALLQSIIAPRQPGVRVATVIRVSDGRAYLSTAKGILNIDASPILRAGARVLIDAQNRVIGKTPDSANIPTYVV